MEARGGGLNPTFPASGPGAGSGHALLPCLDSFTFFGALRGRLLTELLRLPPTLLPVRWLALVQARKSTT